MTASQPIAKNFKLPLAISAGSIHVPFWILVSLVLTKAQLIRMKNNEPKGTLDHEQATPERIKQFRQEQSAPILLGIKKLIDDNMTKIPSQGPLGKAVNYMLNHWDALNHYLKDGRLEIYNNRAERSIKPFVIGRKNWLFHGNDVGARAGGVLFSLIETCKAHNIDVFAWLKHALNNIQHADTVEKLELLLPFNVKAEQLVAARAMPQLIFPEQKVVN